MRRPEERKRLKRAGDGRQATDAAEMRADLFGGDGEQRGWGGVKMGRGYPRVLGGGEDGGA